MPPAYKPPRISDKKSGCADKGGARMNEMNNKT